ncbi:hypothetical protein RIVM261_021930 [Rivularia sp. IAM M-261]|nr:hypothetical protein CAL7716_025090 [Calothrix sp. PCC 7716]GJD17237.1 hypothetical protein RIVM261_021930 [Rivularia sp. IAM M-261]
MGTMVYFTREQLSEKDVNTMSYTALIKHTRVYQEAREEGREEQAVNLIVRLLKKRFGQEVSLETRAQIESLSLPTLETLSEDLLDFTSFVDLQPWLDARTI